MSIRKFLANNRKILALISALLCVPLVTAIVLLGGYFVFFPLAFMHIIGLLLLFRYRKTGIFILTVCIVAEIAFIRSAYFEISSHMYTQKLCSQTGNSSHSFTAVTQSDVYAGANMPLKLTHIDDIRLSNEIYVYAYNSSGHSFREGDIISMNGSLRTPKNKSDSGFNMQKWFSGRGAYAEIYKISNLHYVAQQEGFFSDFINPIKTKINSLITQVLFEIPERSDFHRSLSLIRALMFGDKHRLSEKDNEIFQKSGITHILCISGLHFSLILAGIGLILRFIITNRRLRFVILVGIGFVYLSMCSFTPSAMRAGVMAFISAFITARVSDRFLLLKLLTAVAIICLINPYVIFNAGFHLSVLAVVGIMLANSCFEGITRNIKRFPLLSYLTQSAILNISVVSFTFLYSLCSFGGISTVSLISSLFAIPCGMIVLCSSWLGALLAIFDIELINTFFASIISLFSKILYSGAELLANLKLSYLEVRLPDLSLQIFFIILVYSTLFSLFPTKGKWFYISMLAFQIISTFVMLLFKIISC